MFFGERLITKQGTDPGKLEVLFGSGDERAKHEEISRSLDELRRGDSWLQRAHVAVLRKPLMTTEETTQLSRIQAKLISKFISLYGYGADMSSFMRAYFEGVGVHARDVEINANTASRNRAEFWQFGAEAVYRYLGSRIKELSVQKQQGTVDSYLFGHQATADTGYEIDVFEAIQGSSGNFLRLVQIERNNFQHSDIITKQSRWAQDFIIHMNNEDSLRTHLLSKWTPKEVERQSQWLSMYEDEIRFETLGKKLSDAQLIQALFGGRKPASAQALFEEIGAAIYCVPTIQGFIYPHIKHLFEEAAHTHLSEDMLGNLARADELVRLMAETRPQPYQLTSVVYEGKTGNIDERPILNEEGQPYQFYALEFTYPEGL